MTQEVETAAVELDLVSCQTCDLMFVASERRQTCPVCGGEATGPYLAYVLDETGLHMKNGSAVLPAGQQAEDVRPDTVTGSIEEGQEAEEPPPAAADVDWVAVFVGGVATYLQGGGITEDDLRTVLENNLGATPRVSRVTVQRLTAVRDTLRELAAAGVEAEVEAEVAPGGAGGVPVEDVPVAQAEVEVDAAPEEASEELSEPESVPESA